MPNITETQVRQWLESAQDALNCAEIDCRQGCMSGVTLELIGELCADMREWLGDEDEEAAVA